MLTSVIYILIGFVLLIKGADLLVEGASNIAKKFHIPEIIIGLTIISIGTSMPELFVSITSAINGHSDMAVGNIVGSNLANLFLILGLSSIIRPIQFKKETRLIEIPICLFTTIVFVVLSNIGADISRIEGMILIGLFVLFIIYTIIMALKAERFDKSSVIELSLIEREESHTLRDICYVILGIVALKFGGDFTVDNAVKIAQIFNWSEKLIGVTILAVGTSLPELVTSVTAAIKGKSDIAIGNIIGSNIFNILLIIGVSAIITPITYSLSYNKDLMILILGTIILFLFPIIPPKNEMSRFNGIVYFLLYIGYLMTLI